MTNARGARAFVFALFVLSGTAGLVYQVVWSRMLTTHVFGTTVQAVSATLAAFMSGLALGAYWLAKRADQMRSPLRFYAVLEVGIGLYAFLFPLLLKGVLAVYLLFAKGRDPNAFLTALRFALAFALLLAPTAMMGATLPALAKQFARRFSDAGQQGGFLYAANTFGAVAGALLAGFALIRWLGVNGTLFAAGAANIAIGAAAWYAARTFPQQGAEETAPETEPAETFSPRIVNASAAAFGISGFCALAYEVFWTRILVFFLGSTTYAFATMLAAFLTGIAFGSAVLSRLLPRIRRPTLALGAVQALIGIASVLSLPIISEMNAIVRGIGFGGRPTVFAVCVLVMLGPTFLMGASFPLAARIASAGDSRIAAAVGGVYALNTAGAILGSVAAGFLMAPIFGIRNSVLLTALLNLVAAGWVLSADASLNVWERRAPLLTGAAVVFAAFFLFPKTHFFLKSAIYYEQFQDEEPPKTLYYVENADASVTVLEDAEGVRSLYVDTNEAANSSRWDAPSHRVIAHAPLLLHPNPKRALVVGFGMGRTSNSIIQHGVFVDAAEISPGVPIAARQFFSKENNRVLNNASLFRLHVNDGRNYILTTTNRYDMISTGIIHPLVSAGSSNIYSKDFYEMCRGILKEDGVMSQWAPLHRLPLRELKIIVRTFLEVFPHTTVWYKYTPDFIILAGSMKPFEIDFQEWMRRAQLPAVDADLAKDDMDAWSLLDSFLMGPDQARAFAGEGPLHTDDRPLLEFFGSNLGGEMTTQVENIREMATFRESALPYLRNFASAAQKREAEAKLDKYYAATEKLIQGQVEFADARYEKAAELYNEAAHLNQLDPTVGYHQMVVSRLIHSELSREAQALVQPLLNQLHGDPQNLRLIAQIGAAYREAGDLPGAVRMFQRALTISPDDLRFLLPLAETYHRNGQISEAIHAYQKALDIDPQAPMEIYGQLSEAYADAGNMQEAIRTLRQALTIDPTHALTHSRLGSHLYTARQLTQAAEHFERAIELEPNSLAARNSWYELGLIRYEQGRSADSKQAFESALRIDPSFKEAKEARQRLEELTEPQGLE